MRLKVFFRRAKNQADYVMESIRRWVLRLAVSLIFYGAEAQAGSIRLLEYTNQWRFNTDGLALPNDWKDPGYVDADWPGGRGLFGWPPEEPLPAQTAMNSYLPLSSPVNGAPIITHYFRTQFHFPSNPGPAVMLVATNILDDGAVIYLNGREAGRLGLPSGTVVSHNTFANRTREVGAAGVERLVLPTTNLFAGMNTLAVELHQGATNFNTDAIFGLSLTAVFLDPIQITQEPQDETVVQGEDAVFSVAVSGSDPQFQWYRGTASYANQTNATLSINNVLESAAGDYRVVVSGPVNTVTSRIARLTVIRDTFPPVLLSAEEWIPTSSVPRLLLTFNEDIFRGVFPHHPNSGTNVKHYRVEEVGTTNVLTVTQAAVGIGIRAVRLDVSPQWRPGGTYRVTVSNLADIRTNVMPVPQSAYVGFYTYTNLAALNDVWAWNDSGDDLGTAWREVNYPDADWARGRGVFAFDNAPSTFCDAPRNSSLSLGAITYYFRFPFVVGRTSGKVIFTLREAIDDGAVYYLNGQELRRVNMPTGPVLAQTFASTTREANCLPLEITATNLLEGTNVFAAEVHQAAFDFDVVFALEIAAAVQLSYPQAVSLSIARTPFGELSISWPGRAGILESAPELEGPWTNFTTNSPALVQPLDGRTFFRLRPP